MKSRVLATLSAMLALACISPSQSTQLGSATAAPKPTTTPLLLEKNEGEQRLWRPEPGEVDPGGFILKGHAAE
jgi:hypothetical protein